MSFANAQQSWLLLGNLNFTGYLKGVSSTTSTNMLDITSLADTAFQFMPGREESNYTLDMMFDTITTTGLQEDVLTAWKASTPLPLSFLPNGTARGSFVELAGTLETAFTPNSTLDSVVMVNVAALTDGFTNFGIVYDYATAISTDTTGTSVDNTAATSNGGVAHLHVTAFSGLTSDAIILEHSIDNSVWATLGTFTTVTGTTSQRLVVAPGTTVRRYIRFSDDVTGTGTCTRTLAFARN